MTTIAALGKRAAQYHAGGLILSTAAAVAVDEALDAGETTYPQLYTIVRQLGRLNGFASFYLLVRNGFELEYRYLIGFTTHGLHVSDITNIQSCARLMVRVEAIRCLLKGRVRPRQVPGSPPVSPQDIAEYLTIKEMGLRCSLKPNKALLLLQALLDTGEITYRSLHQELTARHTEVEGIIYTYSNGTRIPIGDLILGCSADNFTLILEISATLVRYYGDHLTDWDDDALFGSRPAWRWWPW